MSMLADFHFIRPAWLILAPVVVWLGWWGRNAQDPLRGWRAVMDQNLLDALTVERTTSPPHRLRGAGLLAAWLLATVALAGPTWRPEPSPFADDPVPVMLVLKAGESMDQSDLLPSRRERARLKIADFAELRKGQPLGLVTYAGSAHLVLPPTRDTSVVATMAADISPEIMPKPGDDLAAALQLAERTLGSAGGTLVVIADTVNESSQNDLAEFHAQNRTPVHILGIARTNTPEWDTLRIAASALGATLTPITPDEADVRALVKDVARVPVVGSDAGEGTRWAEAGWWLIPLIALLSLLDFRRVQNLNPTQGLP
jgi:Ca-activated chloride channel family protein